MPDMPAGGLPSVSIEFGAVEWREEVERYDRSSPARAQAQSARKTMEAYTTKLEMAIPSSSDPQPLIIHLAGFEDQDGQ